MKAKELRPKSLSELTQTLKEQVAARFKLRMQHGSGQLTNTSLLPKNKKAIARIKTLIHQKKLEGAA